MNHFLGAKLIESDLLSWDQYDWTRAMNYMIIRQI